MAIEENKRIVRDFMQSLEKGEADFDLLADDLLWWVQGHGNLDKTQFRALVAGAAQKKKPSIMTIRHVTAEDDRVAVECDGKGRLNNGRAYENSYHFLFILRDSRIAEAREHFDTAYAREVFAGT